MLSKEGIRSYNMSNPQAQSKKCGIQIVSEEATR